MPIQMNPSPIVVVVGVGSSGSRHRQNLNCAPPSLSYFSLEREKFVCQVFRGVLLSFLSVSASLFALKFDFLA